MQHIKYFLNNSYISGLITGIVSSVIVTLGFTVYANRKNKKKKKKFADIAKDTFGFTIKDYMIFISSLVFTDFLITKLIHINKLLSEIQIIIITIFMYAILGGCFGWISSYYPSIKDKIIKFLEYYIIIYAVILIIYIGRLTN